MHSEPATSPRPRPVDPPQSISMNISSNSLRPLELRKSKPPPPLSIVIPGTAPFDSKASRDRAGEGQNLDPGSYPASKPPSTQRKPPPASDTLDGGPRTTSYVPPSRQKVQQPAKDWAATHASIKGRSMWSSTSAVQRRRNMAKTNALTEYEAELTGRDRGKQKTAIQKFLLENIDEGWKWKWPRQDGAQEAGYVDELARTGRSAEGWKERDEWLSNTNDSDDDPAMPTTASPDTVSPVDPNYRFESPDDVGESLKRQHLERKRRRQRKLKEELAYNEGLQCFEARRNAWTGARQTLRQPTRTTSQNLSTIANSDVPQDAITVVGPNGSETTTPNGDADSDMEDTEIPVAPPLIPRSNSLRSSIGPKSYTSIYEKVVLQSVVPSCPIPLQDLVNSCIQGWKRDGEWPPKSTVSESMPSAQARKKARKLSVSVAGFLGLGIRGEKDKDKEKEKEREAAKSAIAEEKNGAGTGANGANGGSGQGSGIRKGLQRIWSRGQQKEVNGDGNPNGNPEKSKEVESALA